MSIHFAAPQLPGRTRTSVPCAKALAAWSVQRAANDNGDATAAAANDTLLRAALRHFAEHGISAAREARAKAENAFFAGDRRAYDYWLGITRTLDRRLAAEAERLNPAPALIPVPAPAPALR